MFAQDAIVLLRCHRKKALRKEARDRYEKVEKKAQKKDSRENIQDDDEWEESESKFAAKIAACRKSGTTRNFERYTHNTKTKIKTNQKRQKKLQATISATCEDVTLFEKIAQKL